MKGNKFWFELISEFRGVVQKLTGNEVCWRKQIKTKDGLGRY
jgi:hypothetical protein